MIPISPTNQMTISKMTGTQSNEDLIEALKSKLLDELTPHTQMFGKDELKFSKQENDLDNTNIEIIKFLEKEFEFLKQELVNKNKLIYVKNKLYTSKTFSNSKDDSDGNNFDLETGPSLNSKLVNETISSCSNIIDSSVSKTMDSNQIYQYLNLVKNMITE